MCASVSVCVPPCEWHGLALQRTPGQFPGTHPPQANPNLGDQLWGRLGELSLWAFSTQESQHLEGPSGLPL